MNTATVAAIAASNAAMVSSTGLIGRCGQYSSWFEFFRFMGIGLFLTLQVVGVIAGLCSWRPLKNKWRFVFPLHNIAYRFQEWMSE